MGEAEIVCMVALLACLLGLCAALGVVADWITKKIDEKKD